MSKWSGDENRQAARHRSSGRYSEAEDEPAIELAPGDTSLSFLQRVYRSVTQPMSRRMQAAMAARPHEHPKLGAVATVSMSGDDYAAMLDRAIERSRAGAPDFRLIQHAPARAPGDGEPQC